MKKILDSKFLKDNKLLIILGLLFLFSLTTYYTYSYFEQVVSGNEDAKDVIVTTGVLRLKYEDGDMLSFYDAMPGNSAYKEFTVENTGTENVKYDILWKDVVNAFADKSDIQYTLTCNSDGDNECREIDTSTQMPNTTNNQEIVKSIDISPGEIHTYRLDLNFIYKNENQNDNQGRSITANVQILQATNPTITMDIQNGTLDKNSAIVEYNGSETFTVTPEAGYLLSNMEVSCTNGITNTVVDNQITINDVRLSTTCNVTFTPSYDIHGYVVNQNNDPIANTTVEIHSSTRSAVTDVTGYFEITNVVVGEHELILKQGENELHNSNFTINKGEDFEIAGNTIISTNPTEPIKIKVIIEGNQTKSIITDNTYRVNIQATKAIISNPLNIIDSGTNAIVTVTPNTGYDYSNVICTNGQTGVWTNNTLTVNNVSDDTTCTLGFGAQTYQLSMDTKTSEGMIYKSVIYDENYGELPELEREHYVFNGWFTLPNGGSEVTSTTKVETASNHTIHAQWSPVEYTVVYDCEENGGECSTTTATVSYGSQIDLTNTATKSGYTFVGWNTDKDATTGISSLTMDSAGKTLYAIYKKVITVTYNSNGSTLTKQTDSCEIYNNATDCSFTSPKITRANYTLLGFNENQNASESELNAETQYVTASNKVYYAISYRDLVATFNKNGATSQKVNTTTSTENTITNTCRIYNTTTSCTVKSPIITASTNTPTVIGYSLTASDHTSSWNENTDKIITTDVLYYAQTRNTDVIKNIVYTKSTGVSAVAKNNDSCIVATTYNGVAQAQNCTVKSPTITASAGYNATYWTNNEELTSGITPGDNITLTNSTVTYYAKANDTTKPECTFSTLNYIGIGSTGTIDLTCIDLGSKINSQTLTASNFTISDTTKGSIASISASSAVTNGYKYTITLNGLATGTYTISLKAGVISDNSNNKNDIETSNTITVSNLTITPGSGTAYIGEGAINAQVGGSGYGTLSCESASTSVATCSVSGTTLSISPVAMGNTTITVRGVNGNVSATYNVSVKQTVAIPTNSYCNSLTYNGAIQTLTKTPGTGYTFSNNTGTNATSYTVSAALKPNYAWSDHSLINKTFNCSISPRATTVTAPTSSRAYNGNAYTNNACTATNLVSGDTVTCTMTSASTITNVGSAANTINAVTIKNSSSATVTTNYSVTKTPGTLTVTDATLNGGSVSITGNNTVGSTLIANATNTTPEGTLTYQWWYSDSASATSGTLISGATSSTYVLTNTHLGKYIGVTVKSTLANYTQKPFNDITDSTNKTATVRTIIAIPTNSYCNSLTYNGSSQTLTKTPGTGYDFSNNTGTNATSYTVSAGLSANYIWSDYTTVAKTFSCSISPKAITVTAATSSRVYNGSTYTNSACTATNLLSGDTVTCTMTSASTITNVGSVANTINTVTIKNSSNATVTTNYSVTKTPGTLTVTNATLNGGNVVINGTNKAGETLTANVTNTTPAGTLSYQWWYSTSSSATTGTLISGATSSTYVLTSTHIGKYIGVTVKSTLANYTQSSFNDITDSTNNTYTTMVENIVPRITYNINSNSTYAKSRSVIVTINDDSGIKSNQSVKYGWSTSTTTAPTNYTPITLTNSEGETSASFTANTSNVTGLYYLWVVPNISICDIYNNCNITASKTTGTFALDNTAPNVSEVEARSNFTNVSVTVNAIDAHVGGNISYSFAYTTGTCSSSLSYTTQTSTATSYTLGAGAYNECITVEDSLGNKTPIITQPFRVYINSLSYYTNNYQIWKVPVTGYYRLEAWGSGRGYRGAYTSGITYLTANTQIYVYVGQESQFCETAYSGGCNSSTGTAWNGGGGSSLQNQSGYSLRCEGGGGATDYRTYAGTWNNTTGLRERFMVAAGSGGRCGDYTSGEAAGAGGLTGYNPTRYTIGWNGTGATQTAGGGAYDSINSGGFGYGGTGTATVTNYVNCNEAIGGGGGYYGGGGGKSNGTSCGASPAFGGGGSSFISGHSGCNAVNANGEHTGSPNHYKYVFTETLMIDGNGFRWDGYNKTLQAMPNPDSYTGTYASESGHLGNGRARMSFVKYGDEE